MAARDLGLRHAWAWGWAWRSAARHPSFLMDGGAGRRGWAMDGPLWLWPSLALAWFALVFAFAHDRDARCCGVAGSALRP